MAEQYFAKTPACKSNPTHFSLRYKDRDFVFASDSGVFSKGELDKGTKALLDSITNIEGDVLDLGCGWGAISIIIKALYPSCRVLALDVNERALSLCRQNAQKNGVVLDYALSEGALAIGRRFDYILTNPPIRTGKSNVFSLLEASKQHLKQGGSLFAVIGKKQGADSYQKKLLSLFSNADTVHRTAEFKVFRCILEE